MAESGRDRGRWTWKWRGQRWGFERSPIVHDGSLYMDRWILYLFGYTLRLHHIMRPDHKRSLHNHPFWFVTFPLGRYIERYWVPPSADPWCLHGGYEDARYVRAWRPSFRAVDFRHRITALPDGPIWTVVLSGRYAQKWGFFPTPDTFVPGQSTTRNTQNETDPDAADRQQDA